jgi:hypothetical protein
MYLWQIILYVCEELLTFDNFCETSTANSERLQFIFHPNLHHAKLLIVNVFLCLKSLSSASSGHIVHQSLHSFLLFINAFA